MRFNPAFLALAANAALVFGGCSSQLGNVSQLPSFPSRLGSPLAARMAVTAPETPADVSIDGSSTRINTAAEGARKGALTVLRSAGQADRLAPFVAALAPVGAVAGAVSATMNHTAPEVAVAGREELRRRLTRVANQDQLRDRVAAALHAPAGETQPQAIPPLPSASPSPWLVTVSLDQIRLEPAAVGGGQFRLVLTAHVRVRSTEADGASYEAPVEFRSDSELFVEWTADQCRPAQRTAEYGLDQIARQIVRALTST